MKKRDPLDVAAEHQSELVFSQLVDHRAWCVGVWCYRSGYYNGTKKNADPDKLAEHRVGYEFNKEREPEQWVEAIKLWKDGYEKGLVKAYGGYDK